MAPREIAALMHISIMLKFILTDQSHKAVSACLSTQTSEYYQAFFPPSLDKKLALRVVQIEQQTQL